MEAPTVSVRLVKLPREASCISETKLTAKVKISIQAKQTNKTDFKVHVAPGTASPPPREEPPVHFVPSFLLQISGPCQ